MLPVFHARGAVALLGRFRRHRIAVCGRQVSPPEVAQATVEARQREHGQVLGQGSEARGARELCHCVLRFRLPVVEEQGGRLVELVRGRRHRHRLLLFRLVLGLRGAHPPVRHEQAEQGGLGLLPRPVPVAEGVPIPQGPLHLQALARSAQSRVLPDLVVGLRGSGFQADRRRRAELDAALGVRHADIRGLCFGVNEAPFVSEADRGLEATGAVQQRRRWRGTTSS
mmetsp:Transcript_6041/g.16920  ORF Transcript_6041/g.16920 Transcript_6041/m.16920 type:complete len:226 (+) Transcript_6041:128-805(+)